MYTGWEERREDGRNEREIGASEGRMKKRREGRLRGRPGRREGRKQGVGGTVDRKLGGE